MRNVYYILMFVAGFSTISCAGTIYVDATASGANNGSSWTDAYTTLSEALAEANAGTETDSILVAAGTYYPTGDQTSTDRNATFGIFRGGIKIYGGYPNGGGIRDIWVNPAILDGEIGLATLTADNSCHVMTIINIPQTADSIVVDGLTIRKGNANAIGSAVINGQSVLKRAGGGLVMMGIYNTQKTCIRNCHFEENRVRSLVVNNPNPFPGGGTVLEGTGAAIYINNASPYIYNCNMTNNYAEGSKAEGGAMYLTSDTAVVEKCNFTGNKAYISGTAVNFRLYSRTIFKNCIFKGNSSINSSISSSSVIFSRSYSSSHPTISGCLLYENPGHAIAGPMDIIHCTVSKNNVGFRNHDSATGDTARILNSIIYGNTSSDIQLDVDAAFLSIDYSLISGGFAGTGNIDANPLFAEESSGDFRLTASSTAINAGSNLIANTAGITEDLDGNARLFGNSVDMGAYEYPGVFQPAEIIDLEGDSYLQIHPNPVSGTLHIVCPETLCATISGIDGKRWLYQENALMIDTGFLPAGMYMIHFTDDSGNEKISRKFIKID